MGISQEEIVTNAQTVTKGLEALRLEHQSLLGGLKVGDKARDNDEGPGKENEALIEKCSLLERSLEMIDLGLGEAHVMAALAGHLQAVEAEKQKLRSQVKRLCQENAWLRDELATTQQKLQASEQTAAQLEEEKKHLEFMNSIKKYDSDVANQHSEGNDPNSPLNESGQASGDHLRPLPKMTYFLMEMVMMIETIETAPARFRKVGLL